MAKSISLGKLINEVERLKQEGKTVIQTHGVFDLIHPGIISHLEEARAAGDVLVVTVIRDRDVRRGPGRPIFSEEKRLHSVLSLGMVDYACLVSGEFEGDKFRLTLGVDVPVMTVCPCSLAISDQGAHSQRAVISIRCRFSGLLWLEELIETAESAGSSPVSRMR